jgi:hypothetical protein
VIGALALVLFGGVGAVLFAVLSPGQSKPEAKSKSPPPKATDKKGKKGDPGRVVKKDEPDLPDLELPKIPPRENKPKDEMPKDEIPPK